MKQTNTNALGQRKESQMNSPLYVQKTLDRNKKSTQWKKGKSSTNRAEITEYSSGGNASGSLYAMSYKKLIQNRLQVLTYKLNL